MKLQSWIILILLVIAVLCVCVYFMLRNINASMCKITETLPYNAIIRQYDGSSFTTDSARYSAEIVAMGRITDSLNKGELSENNATASINNIRNYKDSTIYDMITIEHLGKALTNPQ